MASLNKGQWLHSISSLCLFVWTAPGENLPLHPRMSLHNRCLFNSTAFSSPSPSSTPVFFTSWSIDVPQVSALSHLLFLLWKYIMFRRWGARKEVEATNRFSCLLIWLWNAADVRLKPDLMKVTLSGEAARCDMVVETEEYGDFPLTLP